MRVFILPTLFPDSSQTDRLLRYKNCFCKSNEVKVHLVKLEFGTDQIY